ncbi:MAG TPA: hypothetical protein VJC09_00900 [Candidatus Saccharimonadales bacterium]|nr:hypothetical protein [Candidatus Saccharimonadales bacterium]
MAEVPNPEGFEALFERAYGGDSQVNICKTRVTPTVEGKLNNWSSVRGVDHKVRKLLDVGAERAMPVTLRITGEDDEGKSVHINTRFSIVGPIEQFAGSVQTDDVSEATARVYPVRAEEIVKRDLKTERVEHVPGKYEFIVMEGFFDAPESYAGEPKELSLVSILVEVEPVTPVDEEGHVG